MPFATSTPLVGAMTPDRRGDKVELLSVKNWRASTKVLSAGAWTSLGDGSPRSALLLFAAKTNAPNVIISHSNLSAISSNDPSDAKCGMPIPPGSSLPLSFTENIAVYARVAAGGAASRLHIAEAL